MTPVDCALPPGFDYIDLCELLDLVGSLLDFLRVETYDEQPGEREVRDRATLLLERYKLAS